MTAAAACSPRPESSSANQSNTVIPSPTPTLPGVRKDLAPVDVVKLAGKTPDDFDREFGRPDEAKKQDGGVEYRLYKVFGQSRGLAVRFFGGKARQFNLIIDRPIATSKEALKSVFNIDVAGTRPLPNPKEPLTESYKGTFGGVKFSKVAAKKREDGNGFILVLAEIEK